MHKDIKEKEMTSTQRYLLAYQTCQWWNAVFVQAKRFFDVLDENHGERLGIKGTQTACLSLNACF